MVMPRETFEAVVDTDLHKMFFPMQGTVLMKKYYGIAPAMMALYLEYPKKGVWVNWLDEIQTVGDELVEKFSGPSFFRKIQKLWKQKTVRLEKGFQRAVK